MDRAAVEIRKDRAVLRRKTEDWRNVMIREWEQDTQAFQYEEADGQITLLQWKGCAPQVQVPEEIEGAPVTAIGRKAFLSDKRIQEVILPESVMTIGDWAFAYCSRLVQITLPRHAVSFGKGVFLQCGKLEQIILTQRGENVFPEAESVCIGSLLAAAAHKLDDPYLLSTQEAGGEQWLRKWDAKLLQVMRTPDREGYSKTLLCGEEDYGSKENNLDYFLSQKRRSKVRLALLRLLHDKGLGPEMRELLTEYVAAHGKGCTHEETWRVVKEEYGVRREYYDLMLETGALTEANFDEALCDMGGELAEMKAYLLKQKEERFGNDGFFEFLTL